MGEYSICKHCNSKNCWQKLKFMDRTEQTYEHIAICLDCGKTSIYSENTKSDEIKKKESWLNFWR